MTQILIQRRGDADGCEREIEKATEREKARERGTQRVAKRKEKT